MAHGRGENNSSATRIWWSGISGGRVAISVAEQNAKSPPPPSILKLLTVVLKTKYIMGFVLENRSASRILLPIYTFSEGTNSPLSLALQSFELSDGSVAFALVSVSVTEYSMEILPVWNATATCADPPFRRMGTTTHRVDAEGFSQLVQQNQGFELMLYFRSSIAASSFRVCGCLFVPALVCANYRCCELSQLYRWRDGASYYPVQFTRSVFLAPPSIRQPTILPRAHRGQVCSAVATMQSRSRRQRVVLFVLIAFLAFAGVLIHYLQIGGWRSERALLGFAGMFRAITFFGEIGVTVFQQRVLIAMTQLVTE